MVASWQQLRRARRRTVRLTCNRVRFHSRWTRLRLMVRLRRSSAGYPLGGPAIAIARMLLSERGDIRKYCLLVWTRARLVVEGGTLQLCQQAGASHRDAFGRQETHRSTVPCRNDQKYHICTARD